MNNNNLKILDIPFTTFYEKEIFDYLKENFCKENPEQLFLATPNPEMLLECRKNERFRKLLQSTNLNLPDGNGLIWANIFLNKVKNTKNKILIIFTGIVSLFGFILHKKNNSKRFNKAIHGSDFTLQVCKDKDFGRQGIFFLGKKHSFKPNTTKTAKEKIEKIAPETQIVGYYDSDPIDETSISRINDSKAKILFVAFGAPDQELWIEKNIKNLPNIKMAVGIGGSFDFIAEVIPRAPLWMRNIGFEWLYRLSLQPKRRFIRIWNATIVFPYYIIKDRVVNPDIHNISGI